HPRPVTSPGLRLRPPNHLTPIKSGIVRAFPFADIDRGEDTDFTRRVYSTLKREEFIDAVLYHYEFRSQPQRRETTHAGREAQARAAALVDIHMLRTLSGSMGVFVR